MSSQPPEPDLRNIWQNQETEKTTMSVEEVRLKAQRFLSKNRRDVIARSIFAVIAAVFCGIVVMKARVTSIAMIAGLVMAMLLASTIRNLYLAYRRSRGTLPAITAGPNMALTSCLEFYRGELERQREIARQPAWQLVTALLIIAYLTRSALMRRSWDSLHVVLVLVLFAAAGLIALLAVRKFEARRVQDEIDALDTFEEKHH